MLAPVMPINQLFLAIQNHRNNELQNLIYSKQFDLRKPCEAGYMAIHVACRFNNIPAIDLIVQQGIPIEMTDTSGNTTLHYAAKAGHLDLCKLLIERGCSPARRNSNNQTPYDTTDSHLVRQYLLPLIFKYENNQMGTNPSSQEIGYNTGYQQSTPMNHVEYGSTSSYPTSASTNGHDPYNSSNTIPNTATATSAATNSTSTYNPPPFPSSGYPMQQPPTSIPPSSTEVSLVTESTTSYVTPPLPPPSGPPPSFHQNVNSAPIHSNIDHSNIRKIKADGFHSSASDPELQAKYGHIKPAINIAPPPMATTNSTGNQYSAYSSTANGPPPVYNRYPVYDPLAPTPTAPTQYQQQYQQSTTSQLSYAPPPNSSLPPPPPPPTTTATTINSSYGVPPPTMSYNISQIRPQSSFRGGGGGMVVEEEVISADSSSNSVL